MLKVFKSAVFACFYGGYDTTGEAGDEELADEFGVVVAVLCDLSRVELDLSDVLARELSAVEDEENLVAFVGVGCPVGDK